MPGDNAVIAPAVRDSLLLCELREYSHRASHLSFSVSMRRAMIDALAHAGQRANAATLGPLAVETVPEVARKDADDV